MCQLRWIVPGIRHVDPHRVTVPLDDRVQHSQLGRLAGALPPSHEAGVAHGAIQPGLELGLEQALLHRILGVRMPADGRAESPGDFLHTQQEPFERRRITSGREADLIAVLCRDDGPRCFQEIHVFCIRNVGRAASVAMFCFMRRQADDTPQIGLIGPSLRATRTDSGHPPSSASGDGA
jgi:hypothetical protein